ncbi:MAG: methyltransferase domain-containing protein [Candidatus Omnitrophota bacterium]
MDYTKNNLKIYRLEDLRQISKNTNHKICLDLGCGSRKKEGYIGVDIVDLEGVDIVCSIENGIPINNDCVDKIHSVYFFEHINNLIFLFQEIYRICKNGAIVKITVPYYSSINAFKDPTHKQFFTEETFRYFSKDKWYGSDYNFNINFKLLNIKYHYSRLIRKWYPEFIKRLMRRYFLNMVGAMTVELEVEK